MVLVIAGGILFSGCAAGPFGNFLSQEDKGQSLEQEDTVDALSMPLDPTVDLSYVRGAAYCGECHLQHYKDWKQSRHSHAMKDVVFRAFVEEMQAEHNGAKDRFCTQCHSAIGTRSRDIVPGFSFEELSSYTLEGATCEGCHRVVGVERPFNSGHLLDVTGDVRGPRDFEGIVHPIQGVDEFRQAVFCAGCHDVRGQSGLKLESPYEEWLDSPSAARSQTCQDCHMPLYEGRIAPYPNLTTRKDLHSHRFVGIDVLDHDPAPKTRDETEAFLRSSARLTLIVPAVVASGTDELPVEVEVTNLISGHRLPTGSTFFRQLWLSLEVRDVLGNVLFTTGDQTEEGDLRTDDNGLVIFGTQLVDSEGERTFRPWRAISESIDTTLAPEETRKVQWLVPLPLGMTGPLYVQGSLNFRAFPPKLLRSLNLYDEARKLSILELASVEAEVLVDIVDEL